MEIPIWDEGSNADDLKSLNYGSNKGRKIGQKFSSL